MILIQLFNLDLEDILIIPGSDFSYLWKDFMQFVITKIKITSNYLVYLRDYTEAKLYTKIEKRIFCYLFY